MAQITLNSTGVASSGSLVLQTNGTTSAVTVDASQNVGVGVTPSAWFSTSGSKAIETGGPSLLNYANTLGVLVTGAYLDSTGTFKYKNSNKAYYYGQDSVSGYHAWYNAPTGTAGNTATFTEAMRIDSSGNLLVGVSSANANGGVLQLKSGITFPATAVAATDANTLDDYEEGTYTPVPTNITIVSGTPVYAGKYTKIGNIVQAFFEMSGGNITITGGSSNLSLPFTAPTVDATGGYTNGATGIFVGGLLAYGTVVILTTSLTSTSISGSLVYRVA